MKFFNANAIDKIRRTVRRVMQSPYANAPDALPQHRNDLAQVIQAYDSEESAGVTLVPNADGFIPGRLVRWNGTDWSEVSDIWILALPEGAVLENEAYYTTARRIGIIETDEEKRPGFAYYADADHAVWRGGLDAVYFNGAINGADTQTLALVERDVVGPRFCTVSGGTVTFTAAGTYLVTYGVSVLIASSNHASNRMVTLGTEGRIYVNAAELLRGRSGIANDTRGAFSGSATSMAFHASRSLTIEADVDDELTVDVVLYMSDAANGTATIYADVTTGVPPDDVAGNGTKLEIVRMRQHVPA